eukprot:731143-Rhodomonas_salina.1
MPKLRVSAANCETDYRNTAFLLKNTKLDAKNNARSCCKFGTHLRSRYAMSGIEKGGPTRRAVLMWGMILPGPTAMCGTEIEYVGTRTA